MSYQSEECPACQGSGRRAKPNEHVLKTSPKDFQAVLDLQKRFEIQKDDRHPRFRVGDRLELREWCEESEKYTGRQLWVRVTYKTTHAQSNGYCVMGVAHL